MLDYMSTRQDWFRKTQQFREMFEESQIAQSAGGPEVDRRERRDDEFLREARQHNNDTAHAEALFVREADKLGVPQIPGHQKASNHSRATSRNCSNDLSVKAHQMSSCVLRRMITHLGRVQ